MKKFARAIVLVTCLMTCLPPHVYPSQSPFFPPDYQQDLRRTTSEQQQQQQEQQQQHGGGGTRGQFVRTDPLQASSPQHPASSRGSPAALSMFFPTQQGVNLTPPQRFSSAGFPSSPTNGIPFQQIFGAGLDSSSPLDLLGPDQETDFVHNPAVGAGRRRGVELSPRTGFRDGEPRQSLERSHPFSSKRLNPVPTSEAGVSLVAGSQDDPFDRGRARLSSLFDTDKARRYSLDAPSTFEKPISKASLPDVNSPIRLDLNEEELERVAFANSHGHLPPSRGVSAILDKGRPKLPPLPSLHKLRTRRPSRPSPPAPSSLTTDLSPESRTPWRQQPGLRGAGRSGEEKKSSADGAAVHDDGLPVPKLSTEKPPTTPGLPPDDTGVNDEPEKPADNGEGILATKQLVDGTSDSRDPEASPYHEEGTVATKQPRVDGTSESGDPGDRRVHDDHKSSTTERPEHDEDPPPIHSPHQPPLSDGSLARKEPSDLDNSTGVKSHLETGMENEELLPSTTEEQGLDDSPDDGEMYPSTPRTQPSDSEEDVPPVDELLQLSLIDMSAAKRLNVVDAPAVGELKPGAISDEVEESSSSGSPGGDIDHQHPPPPERSSQMPDDADHDTLLPDDTSSGTAMTSAQGKKTALSRPTPVAPSSSQLPPTEMFQQKLDQQPAEQKDWSPHSPGKSSTHELSRDSSPPASSLLPTDNKLNAGEDSPQHPDEPHHYHSEESVHFENRGQPPPSLGSRRFQTEPRQSNPGPSKKSEGLANTENREQQTVPDSQSFDDDELQQPSPSDTRKSPITDNTRSQTQSHVPADSRSSDHEPQERGNPSNARKSSFTDTRGSRSLSRVPASPFEAMFGKRLPHADDPSFGSLFDNLQRPPPSKSGAFFGRGGLSSFTGMFGQDAGHTGGSDQAANRAYDDDAAYSQNRDVFDVSSLVNRRPSLRLFASDKK